MVAVAALGVFGSVIGSFLNVVVYRVPLGRSIVSPPSACGSCGHVVRAYDNIPLLSWLLLRGRCRDCGARISARYPLVELGGAAFFAVVAWRFVPEIGSADARSIVAGILQLVAFLYLAAISLALAIIDAETRRLPNVIVVPAYAVGAVLLGASAALSGAWPALLTATIGAAALGGFYLVVALIRPGGMGLGDVKLAGALGLYLGWLGWGQLAVGALAGVLLGGVFAVIVLIVRRDRKLAVPYGPWLLAGAWVGILAGAPIASAYLRLFGVG
jgi:leader peptidase (prepilin peptidase)/N-methyltransferase